MGMGGGEWWERAGRSSLILKRDMVRKDVRGSVISCWPAGREAEGGGVCVSGGLGEKGMEFGGGFPGGLSSGKLRHLLLGRVFGRGCARGRECFDINHPGTWGC